MQSSRTPHQQSMWTRLRGDVDRICAAAVCTSLGAIALAGSATHVLRVGAYPGVDVGGWMVWTVAGSLEVLAAYATWELRRRTGWNRTVPAVVLVLAVTFIVLANLAAADATSWAAGLPWAQAFAVAPPVSYLSVAAIAETRDWRRPGRARRRPTDQAVPRPATTRATPPRPDQLPRTENLSEPAPYASAPTSTSFIRTTPGELGERLALRPEEDRAATIVRWVGEGHSRKEILRMGPALLGVSDSTVKRQLREIALSNHLAA